jgi:hypothetical protein
VAGSGRPARIAPLFLLYDYSFRVEGMHTKEQSLAYAYQTGWCAPMRFCCMQIRIRVGKRGVGPGW